jgi:hypothetical protein
MRQTQKQSSKRWTGTTSRLVAHYKGFKPNGYNGHEVDSIDFVTGDVVLTEPSGGRTYTGLDNVYVLPDTRELSYSHVQQRTAADGKKEFHLSYFYRDDSGRMYRRIFATRREANDFVATLNGVVTK